MELRIFKFYDFVAVYIWSYILILIGDVFVLEFRYLVRVFFSYIIVLLMY